MANTITNMDPTPKVGTAIHNPNYDVELKELTTNKAVGLILCNNLGVSDRRGMQEAYMPRTAMQLSQGGNSYDDIELPYSVDVQTSMIGGRGMDDFAKDKTRYADGFRMDTSGVNPICGPAVIEQTGFRSTAQDLLMGPALSPPSRSLRYETLRSYLADPSLSGGYMQIALTGTNLITSISIYLKGFTGNKSIYYDLWLSSSANQVNLRYNTILRGSGVDQWYKLPIEPTTYIDTNVKWWVQPASGTISLVVVDAPGVTTVPVARPGENILMYHWTNRGYYSKISSSFTSTDTDYKFFEYKRALYVAKRFLDKSGTAIYRNGYRGMAQPNTGVKHKLRTQFIDLPVNALKGSIAMISNGPGELEDQNWREVTGNSATEIYVTPPWNITHTADTEFVILGTNHWEQVATSVNLTDKTVTDTLPLEDYVVFAFGDQANLGFYREGKNSLGVWESEWVWHTNTYDRYHFLALAQNTEGTSQLWGANANNCQVSWAEPLTFEEMTSTDPAAQFPVFDVWKEVREELDITIARLNEDIASNVDTETIRLQRLKEDAQEEYDDLTVRELQIQQDINFVNSSNEPEKLRLTRLVADLSETWDDLTVKISQITDDITYETNSSPERLSLVRMKQDAQNEVTDLTAIISKITSDIASTTDADLKRELERLKLEKTDQKDSASTTVTRLTADITSFDAHNPELIKLNRLKTEALDEQSDLGIQRDRASADLALLTTHNPELIKLNRLMIETLDEQSDLLTTIDRLTEDIARVVNSELLTYERQKEDALREKEELLTYVKAGDTSSHITNMVIYGSPGIPYIIKETEVGSIYENVYSKVPLGEIESVRSEINGRAAMAYGVYLYFNLEGGWIERLYDQQMNDVSPNQNEGLPKERQGEVSKLMPYAGRWYASINAGNGGTSSVLLNNELGWHEIYRASAFGTSITDIHVQAIPGIANADQLWIAEGMDIIAVPISISPLKQNNYMYFGNGENMENAPYIETAWLDFNYKDVNKYFHTLKLFVDMPNVNIQTGYEYQCHVWYKTDKIGNDSWIYIGTKYAKDDIQTFDILYKDLHQVWGKQIKFKIAMQSNVEYRTPRLKAWICDAVIRFEVKKSWNLTFQLQPDTDLLGTKILMDPDFIYTSLDTWANSMKHAVPLRMRTNDPNTDDKLVFIDPATIQRKTVNLSTNKTGAKKDFINIGSIVIYEV